MGPRRDDAGACVAVRGVRASEAGGVGRVFMGLLATVLILGLGGLVLYLLSDINARRYRLNAVGDELVVEQGRFFPVGFERYLPRVKALADAYAPVEMPDGELLTQPETYDDRADLDRALFALLAGWARKGLEANDAESLGLAAKYIDRSDLLPGLSEQQREDLRTLRADLAYKHGRFLVWRMEEMLHDALAEFKLSKKLGTSRPTDADLWIEELEGRIRTRSNMRRAPTDLLPEIPMPDTFPGPEKEPEDPATVRSAPKNTEEPEADDEAKPAPAPAPAPAPQKPGSSPEAPPAEPRL